MRPGVRPAFTSPLLRPRTPNSPAPTPSTPLSITSSTSLHLPLALACRSSSLPAVAPCSPSFWLVPLQAKHSLAESKAMEALVRCRERFGGSGAMNLQDTLARLNTALGPIGFSISTVLDDFAGTRCLVFSNKV